MHTFTVKLKLNFGEDLWTVDSTVEITETVRAHEVHEAWLIASDRQEAIERDNLISISLVSIKAAV